MDIQCNLQEEILQKDSPLLYEALSYTWGSSENPLEIYIENATLLVTQNLSGALQHLRYHDQPRTLWIDAICVNQKDLKERSQQVPRMADIYTLAKRVVVWLGPEADNSSWALKTINAIGSMIEMDWQDHKIRPSYKADCAGELHWADRNAEIPFASREFVPIEKLIQRAWFERLWIQQEIALATDAVLVCGFNSIPWSAFRNAIFYLHAKIENS